MSKMSKSVKDARNARANTKENAVTNFMGGTSSTVTFNEDLSIADIDAQVVPVVEKITGDSTVQT